METKKHLFGTTEKSDFILNMTKEGAQKLLGVYSIVAVILLAVCALPYYLTKDVVKYTEELSTGMEVQHLYTENTVAIMSTALVAVGFLSVLMFIIAKMKNESTIADKKGFIITGALLIGLSLVSMLMAQSIQTAFFGGSARNDGFLVFLACIGCIFLSMIVTGEKWRVRFTDTLVAIGAFEAVFGIVQTFSDKVPNFFAGLFVGFPTGISSDGEVVNNLGYLFNDRICATGLMCTPHALAAVLTVLTAFAAAGVMYSKSRKRRVLYLLSCALMTAASVLTHVFPAVIGIPCVMAVLLIVEIARLASHNVLFSDKLLENSIIRCFITILVSGAVFFGMKAGGMMNFYDENVIFTDTFYRLSTSYDSRAISDEDNIYVDFASIGKANITYELDNKMPFGAGQDNLNQLYGNGTNLRTDRVYNNYIDFILERGIPTFIAYVIFLIYVLWCGIRATGAFFRKKQPYFGAAAFAGMVGYLVSMIWNISSNSSTYFLYICIGMVIMYGQKITLSKKEKQAKKTDLGGK
ncbi:MAG: hypothetical protein IJ696_09190 [Ruminococcus sp.]|nr:hypothetical protein [Ruminococcus sp.]